MNTIRMAVLSSILLLNGAVMPHALWDDLERDFQVMQEQVNTMVSSMQKRFTETAKAVSHALENPPAYQQALPSGKVRFQEEAIKKAPQADAADTYQVKLLMPGFVKESINVKIEKQHKGKHTLVVKASRDFKQEVENKDGGVTRHAEAYSSFTQINKRRQSIEYDNGNITAQLDLPATVDHEGEYQMTFEQEELTITLPLKGKKEDSTRKLTLTD